MEVQMKELSLLLCLRYQPSNKCMYPLERMGIKGPFIHRKWRRDWTADEKNRIRELLVIIVAHNADHQLNYYKHLMCSRIIPLLN